jgi:hypothetical protein
MAALTIDGDEAEHIIDLYAPLHLPEGDTSVRAEPLGRLKLNVGDRVRVRMNPGNGRVMELWKEP